MKNFKISFAIGLLGLAACSDPYAVFSGGELAGTVKPTPDSFEFARDAGTVQLETRPDDPYSVNIACAVVDRALYVSAGDNKSKWVENIEEDSLVRLRIKGDIYELRADRVRNSEEMDVFAEEWIKNSWARDPRKLDEAWVYRLESR